MPRGWEDVATGWTTTGLGRLRLASEHTPGPQPEPELSTQVSATSLPEHLDALLQWNTPSHRLGRVRGDQEGQEKVQFATLVSNLLLKREAVQAEHSCLKGLQPEVFQILEYFGFWNICIDFTR